MIKRGQVFILAAILIVVILFSLAAIRNRFEQEEIRGDFETLSENFKIESSKLINSAMKLPDADVHEAFKSFSTMFTSYAKGKNPKYGLIYVLGFEDRIQVTNFLDREIIVRGCGVGGAEYSVNISGGFSKINASLNFEGFDIRTDIVPAGLEFDCGPIDTMVLSTLNPPYKETTICAFLYQEVGVTETELAVVIDGAPYKSCIREGVPEIMQVGIMRQGEQAKVSATGDCISEDFCEGLNAGQCGTCGLDVCFWWQTTCPPPYDGLCLNKYAYPNRDPVSGACPATTCNPLCIGDRIFYTDDCGNPIGTSIENCEAEQKVCRDNTFQGYTGGDNPDCCTKYEDKKCCAAGNDVCLISSCGTLEGVEDCDDVEVCRDASYGVSPIQCCIKEDHLKCVGNEIHQFNSCGTDEGWKQTCSTNTICRDSGLPPEIQEDAVCCIEDYKVNCYDDIRYYFDSCGIVGSSLFEDCKGEGNTLCRNASYEGYDGGDESECCKLNYEKRCYNNDVYWYSDCGTRENLKEDCGAGVCEDGQCKVVYKKFECQRKAYIYIEDDECNDPNEEDDHCGIYYGSEAYGDVISVEGDECTVLCYYPSWTACSENPTCGGDPYLDEQECQP